MISFVPCTIDVAEFLCLADKTTYIQQLNFKNSDRHSTLIELKKVHLWMKLVKTVDLVDLMIRIVRVVYLLIEVLSNYIYYIVLKHHVC